MISQVRIQSVGLLVVPLFCGLGLADDVTPEQIYKKARVPKPAETPAWVNAIPDRIADVLVEKHLYKDGPVWGTARREPTSELAYDEMGSSTFYSLVKQYDLWDQVGGITDADRAKMITFWQGWQNLKTGRFEDPRDPNRQPNEKYIVGLLGALGSEPLVPWTTTSTSKKIETDVFLTRTKEDPDWANGGWGVGSHTGLMAMEIMNAIDEGQTDLIPDLEKGVNQILSHQDPATGLWGAPETHPMRRIGGTLKVIGRVYFSRGLKVPYSRELADTLLDWQFSGEWYRCGQDSCVPRNVAEIVAYCLEVSDYRKKELHAMLRAMVEDYKSWVTPRGETLMHRSKTDTVGLQYTTIYGLGILGGYLNWTDCKLPNPLENRTRGIGVRYRLELQADNTVKVVENKSFGQALAE